MLRVLNRDYHDRSSHPPHLVLPPQGGGRP
jgi:hypothetical protein